MNLSRPNLPTFVLAAAALGGCMPAMRAAEPDAPAPPAAQALQVDLPSGDATVRGTMFVTEGAGPHATVLLLHGFPGSPRQASLAQGLQRAGINVLFVHYRGTWRSNGVFSLDNALADVGAGLDYLRSPASVARYRIDPERIALVGHSMGGWLALTTAAGRHDVRCVGALTPGDLGRFGARWATEPAYRAAWTAAIAKASSGDAAPIRPAVPAAAMVAQVARDPGAYDLTRLGDRLRGRAVLLVGARDDETTPSSEHVERVRDAYRAAGVVGLRDVMLPGPHNLVAAEPDVVDVVARWLRQDCASPGRRAG